MFEFEIPVMKPKLPKFTEYRHFLEEIDLSQTYSNRGPKLQQYELLLSEKIGISSSQELVLCSNATTALQGFIELHSDIRWEVPSFTFAASVHATINSKATFDLVDIDPETWMLKTLHKENGHLVVVPFGAAFDPNLYREIEVVLIDAAASIGNASKWITSIRKNWAVVFSLHATKPFGIGEGGAIVFGDPNRAQEFRSWINFGFMGSRDASAPGTNGKMSEIHSAVGLSVMNQWAFEEAEWKNLRIQANQIAEKFQLSPSAFREADSSPYWIINTQNEEHLLRIKTLFEVNSIETRLWWSKGCHKMPYFSKFARGTYEVTDQVSSKYLGLPLFRGMSPKDFERIDSILEKASNG